MNTPLTTLLAQVKEADEKATNMPNHTTLLDRQLLYRTVTPLLARMLKETMAELDPNIPRHFETWNRIQEMAAKAINQQQR